MGISLNLDYSEGCCEHILEKYKNRAICIDNCSKKCEARKKTSSFVDYILEFEDKYLLIEEKSFIIEFIRRFCKEILNKPIRELSNEILKSKLEQIQSYEDREIKRVIMTESMLNLTSTSSDKTRDCTIFLMQIDKNIEKIQKSKLIYLYCKTGSPADRLFQSTYNLKNLQSKLVSCDKLDRFVERYSK